MSRTFLRFFEVFSRSEAPEKLSKAVVMRFFSGHPRRFRAGQPDYNTTPNSLCQHLFSDFFLSALLFPSLTRKRLFLLKKQ
ncbi:hypothetical protein SUBVAR_05386 [Subdoligranulum variabile DSM 15176]|uniref:Uncharacterized protein n=1 Tax=Subdoligranulum variabile DSM 15176 TaxID=411471 RepID=D1PM29_9FIRM|nr:hypothetical protein SUBVAR_05386 [Subdoligranulum variabile DSM 15176]